MACFGRCLGSSTNKSSGEYFSPFPVLRFSFDELKNATANFCSDHLLGKGGVGKVYKANLVVHGLDQPVAIKQLDDKSNQDTDKFVTKVMAFAKLCRHPNLMCLLGYCAEGNHRLLVYQFMPLGSLSDCLHDVQPGGKILDWNTRMQIAAYASCGLLYLNERYDPPMMHQNLKSTNILLGRYDQLADFGWAGEGPYLDPEYARTRRLTFQSDIYNYGVVLLELITGRKAFNEAIEEGRQSLAEWVSDLLSAFKDGTCYQQFVDPNLRGQFREEDWEDVLKVAAMCLHEEPDKRPKIYALMKAMNSMASRKYVPKIPAASSGLRSSGALESSDDAIMMR